MKTLPQLREERGWRQQDLADRLGVTANTVARWERGEVRPPETARRLVALTFGVHVDAIAWPPPKASPANDQPAR